MNYVFCHDDRHPVKDSHAMSFCSSAFTGVFISLTHLVCQQADESSIGRMSIQFEQDIWECWKALFSSQIHQGISD